MTDELQFPDEKPTFAALARYLGKLPGDKKRAALETSAALAGVSLRVSREFVEAVPKAAKILSADELRQWGELGRKLAMGSADVGVEFFREGIEGLDGISADARSAVFHICSRQLVLSSSIALETFRSVPIIVSELEDKNFVAGSLCLAGEIAVRSAKHSSEFLKHTAAVGNSIQRFADHSEQVGGAVLELAGTFANKTGGMTADLWAELPRTLDKLDAANSIRLIERAAEFLDFGGSVTLHFIAAAGDVLAKASYAFDEWGDLARKVAPNGNAVLIAFLRASPGFFASFSQKKSAPLIDEIRQALLLTAKLVETDAESALAAFKTSARALKEVSIEQFERWVAAGVSQYQPDSTKARRSYFALETRESLAKLHAVRIGLPLEKVQTVLRIYIEALTGKEIEVAPITAMPHESRIGDGKTIYLPVSVEEFESEDLNFKLYKVLAAHGAGQIEFGTFETDTPGLQAAYSELKRLYDASADQRDAFSLSGYIEDISRGERVSPGGAEDAQANVKLKKGSDYRAVLNTFPEPRLARKIFGTLENARIDDRLRRTYRGLRKDLDLMRSFLNRNRPYIFDLPIHQVPFELLFQITLCGGASDDARRFYGQVVSEIESVIESYLKVGDAVVADSLMATSRVYELFQNISVERSLDAETDETEEESQFDYDDKESAEAVIDDKAKRDKQRRSQDISDLFNAWNSLDDEGEPEDLQGAEAWAQAEIHEQPLEADDVAFAYDEWDRELNDYRVSWSRVIEKKVKPGDRNFVELARSRHRGVIASIRRQFQLMKPENLTRTNREFDGEDYDLNALVDLVVDRRAGGDQLENIYTKRLRRQRDVAVSILLDQSSSTARTITRNPLQPYTHPGQRIIEIEKEGLVLMSEALEAVGDAYAISGFTSEGRRNVKFYLVKDFGEKYTDEIERRIGGITFQNNTRLGAAIRHAAAKLLRQESRTKLLIILTDGRPYDHDYGDARYAREDVREALIEAKARGIIPFCITVDRESESELRDLYGNVGYTIIDDVLSLPERMPIIYRRLTS